LALRLNPIGRKDADDPSDGHHFDRRIHEVLREIQEGGADSVQRRIEVADRLEVFAQGLLKQEWDKSKREAGIEN
jgi:hypothetical protein